MTKSFTLQNLLRDLEYTILGTEAHAFLFRVFPDHQEKVVLEPGCGCGKFSLALALDGCEAYLIDVDHEVVEYARRVRGALNSLLGYPLPVQIKVGDIHRMHFPESRFDLVFNEGVPQHWELESLRQGAIDEMTRVSKDLVMVMGNNGLLPEEQEADRTFQFTYKGMPPTRKCFTPDELEMRLKKAGLKAVQVEPVTPGPIEDSVLIAGWGRKAG